MALKGPNRGPQEEKKAAGDKAAGDKDPRDSLWCTFCKKPRHTIERCWKLHGKLSKGRQLGGQNQAYMANSQQQGE